MAKMAGKPSGRLEDVVAILEQLKANPIWIKVAPRYMDENIKAFVDRFSLLERTRHDEDTAQSILELYELFLEADQLGKEIWDTFELGGVWRDPGTRELVDRIEATLDADYLTQIFVTKLRLGIVYGGR